MTFTQTRQNRSSVDHSAPAADDDPSDIHDMLRLIRNEITGGIPREGTGEQPKLDFDFSFDLLSRTADVIELLHQRCRTLQAEKDKASGSRAELEAAQSATRQWQDMSASLKTKLDECARHLADTRARAETAERRLETLAKKLETAEHRADVAESLARTFHDKIVASFGNAARLQEVLLQINANESDAASSR